MKMAFTVIFPSLEKNIGISQTIWMEYIKVPMISVQLFSMKGFFSVCKILY